LPCPQNNTLLFTTYWFQNTKQRAKDLETKQETRVLMFNWRLDTENDDTQHNDTQHNDTQHNDTQHNDTQHNDTQHNDTQHNDNQHKGFICEIQQK
jgi:hypothetical protein